MNLVRIRKRVDKVHIEYKLAKKTCADEQKALTTAEDQLTYIEESQELTQHVAQTIQQKAHDKIAGVVSKCLRTVFTGDDEYGFKIHFERKRGRTEAAMVLTKNGHEIKDPLNFDSGGVVDVAAFALRLSCLVLAKPRLRRVIILDEPFKFVSREFRENVRLLLEGLAEDFKVQFLMVTHIEELKTGKVIEL